MADASEILEALLTEAYQVGDEQKSQLYNEDGTFKEDAKDRILNFNKENVSKIRGNMQTEKENFYKKGFSEGASKWEKDIASKFNLQTDKKGEELIEELFTSIQSKATGDGKRELTEEELIKHPKVLDLVEKLRKEKDDEVGKVKNEYDQFKSGVERSKVFDQVKGKALILFDSFKPILSQDATKASNQKGWFISDLESLNWRVDGDKVIAVDKEGNDLVDDHNNRIPFEKLVKNVFDKYYDSQAAAPRDSSGNEKKGDDGVDVETPTTEKRFMELMDLNKGNLKAQAEISRKWKEFQAK